MGFDMISSIFVTQIICENPVDSLSDLDLRSVPVKSSISMFPTNGNNSSNELFCIESGMLSGFVNIVSNSSAVTVLDELIIADTSYTYVSITLVLSVSSTKLGSITFTSVSATTEESSVSFCP